MADIPTPSSPDDRPLPPPQAPRLRQGTVNSAWLVAFLRTLTALVLREMSTRYGRSPGGYIWAILEPLGMIFIMAFAFGLVMRTPALGTSFILFFATGYLPFNFFQSTAKRVSTTLKFSRPLLAYPAVTWIDAVLGRFLLNALTSLLVTYLIVTGILVFTDARATIDAVPILMAYGMAGLLGLGIGLLNCVIIGYFPVWESFWSIFTRPLFLASGILLMYEELPPLAQSILWWNPMMHVTSLNREGFYATYTSQFFSGTLVLSYALPGLLFGILLMQRNYRDILSRT